MKKKNIFFVLAICALLGFMTIPNARADSTLFFEGTITEFYNGDYVPEVTIEFELAEGLVEIEFGWKPFKGDMDAYMYYEGAEIPWWEMFLATAGCPERDIYPAQAGHYSLELEWWVDQAMEPPAELDWWVIIRQPPEGDKTTTGGVHAFPKTPRTVNMIDHSRSETVLNYPKQCISYFSLAPWIYNTQHFLASEAHIVGLFTNSVDPLEYESDKEAKADLDSWTYSHFIDGVPLESLTHVDDGPIRKDHMRNVYYKRIEHGVFRAGELASLIGTGKHTYKLIEYSDGEVTWVFEWDFWLV